MDPELAAIVQMMPRLDLADPAAARRLAREVLEGQTPSGAGEALAPGVQWTEDALALADGRTMPCRAYRPASAHGRSPVIVYIHGGGFALGDLGDEHIRCMRYAHEVGAVVVALSYRLAPEHPAPAAAEDCWLGLQAVVHRADALGIDLSRLAVGGVSAGAALAAGIVQRARDEHGPRITFQFLLYPVLDDRATSDSMRRYREAPWWDARQCVQMWDLYLGDHRADPPPYVAPARTTDLSNLPPAYILVAEVDPLRDEALEYAMRLNAAGVPVEVHQYAGTFHGFDGLIGPEVSARAMAEQAAILRFALRP